jgi:hypothetical protein
MVPITAFWTDGGRWSYANVALWLRWLLLGMAAGMSALVFFHLRRASAEASTMTAAHVVSPESPRAPLPPTSCCASLVRERAFIARSRRELAEGNSIRALDVLDRYSLEFPRGALATEAMLMRVDLLRSRGDRARALALASQFIAQNPKSPGAAAMRRLIGEARPR